MYVTDFHEPQASESTAQEYNIQPYYHQIIDLLYTTLILVASREQIATVSAHAWFKGCFCVHI